MRVKKLPKHQVIKLYLDNTFTDEKIAFDGNKLRDGDDRPEFEPICIFQERKSRRVFWRKPRRLLFLVQGAVKALKFKEQDETMLPMWTKKEAKEFVNVEIAKSMIRFKPMTWGQFIILLIPIVVILGVILKIAFTIGAF